MIVQCKAYCSLQSTKSMWRTVVCHLKPGVFYGPMMSRDAEERQKKTLKAAKQSTESNCWNSYKWGFIYEIKELRFKLNALPM